VVRPPDNAMQGHLDHTAMGHDQHVTMLVAGGERVDLGDHPALERRSTLAAWDDIPARFLRPPRPGLGESLRQLLGVETLPFAEEDLPQAGRGAGRGAGHRADRRSRLQSALEVARVEAHEAAVSEPATDQHRLAAAFL